ncbi:hypothetical protein IW492_02910 [Enterococcus sp. BWB1-3]|uniref:hypothetical protein n=1 Tax=Enterococcus sp. BWB1-3 TaxID=2787713 RepID=UPI001921C609|nr:hypothetical protein [Enterococcus sp. BWB1-3]MBL1228182.1 hypothetical protein [Enterococcus sp. BWB1-3]
MDNIQVIKDRFDKKSKEADGLFRQYKGLSELEKELASRFRDFSIDVVIWDGYAAKLKPAKCGGFIKNDFGIENLNDTIATLLSAEIKKRKEEIETHFNEIGKELKLND